MSFFDFLKGRYGNQAQQVGRVINRASDRFNPFDKDYVRPDGQQNIRNTITRPIQRIQQQPQEYNPLTKAYWEPTAQLRTRDYIRETPRSIVQAPGVIIKGMGQIIGGALLNPQQAGEITSVDEKANQDIRRAGVDPSLLTTEQRTRAYQDIQTMKARQRGDFLIPYSPSEREKAGVNPLKDPLHQDIIQSAATLATMKASPKALTSKQVLINANREGLINAPFGIMDTWRQETMTGEKASASDYAKNIGINYGSGFAFSGAIDGLSYLRLNDKLASATTKEAVETIAKKYNLNLTPRQIGDIIGANTSKETSKILGHQIPDVNLGLSLKNVGGEPKKPTGKVDVVNQGLINKAKNYKTPEIFEKRNAPIQADIRPDFKTVRLDMFPNEAVKGQGITKQYVLNALKDANDQGISDITPSLGIWTKDGVGFMDKLAKEGWVVKDPAKWKNEYKISPKIAEWNKTNPLTDIWNRAKLSQSTGAKTGNNLVTKRPVLKQQGSKVSGLQLEQSNIPPTKASLAIDQTQAGRNLLSQPDYNTSNKLLPTSKQPTLSEARKIFKKTGEVVDFVNAKKSNNRVLIAGKEVAVKNGQTANNYLKKVGYDDMVGEVKDLKDISNLDKGLKDVYRNFRDAFGGEKSPRYQAIKAQVLDKFDDAKAGFVQDQMKWVDDLKTNIVDGLGIKKRSKESAAVQQFGEGLIKYDDLLKKFGKDRADKIVQADSWFRSQYDNLLEEVNAVRKQIYPNNPDKIIPRRNDYYRHFTEMAEGIEGLKNIFDTPSQIGSNLAGISEYTKPKSKYLSFAQERLGNKTEYDAVGGFLDYIKAQTYAKNIDPQIEVFRGLRDSLQKNAQGGKLNNFTKFLDDFANDLAGKTNPLDRAFQEYVPGGRTTFKAINWLNNRVKKNVILGNASSAIAQIFNVPQGFADAGPINFTKGSGKALASIFTGGDSAIKQSRFVTERYSQDIYNQFNKGLLKKGEDFAAWMIGALDEVGTKAIWHGEYEKGLTKGLNGDALIRFADDATRRMVAGRGVGEVPLMQKAKVFQMVAPFQLEVENLWHVMKDFVDEKAFGKLAVLFAAGYVMNKGAEKIRGNGVVFDPIEAMADAFSAFKEEDNKLVGGIRATGRVAGEVLSNVPGGQTLASIYPEYGMKIPGTDEKLTRKEFFGEEDPTRFGAGPLFTRGLSDPLYKVVTPYAGQQLKRTIEGVGTMAKGYAEDAKKNVQFPVEQNAANWLRAPLFGKYSTTEGQKYTKEDLRALGTNESALFKAGNKGIYDATQLNRRAEEQLKSLKSGKSNIEQVSPGIIKTENGKFGALIDNEVRTFDTQQEAQIGIAKSETLKDGKQREIGDKIIYRSGDTVKAVKKLDYNDSLYYAQMTSMKMKGDIKGWMAVAGQKLVGMEEMLKDPSLDQVERLQIENRIETLLDQLDRYSSQGGFRKGSGSGGSKKRPALNVYKPQSTLKLVKMNTSIPQMSSNLGGLKGGNYAVGKPKQLRTKRMV